MATLSGCSAREGNVIGLVGSPNQMEVRTPPLPTLPQRVSLAAQAAQSLREGIRAGRWGERLPGERKLCEELQVSRDTLRVALDELQRRGWIEVAERQRRRIKHKQAVPNAGPRKRVIALLSSQPFLALPLPIAFILDAVRDKLSKAGNTAELHASPSCFSAKPAKSLEKLVKQHPAAAWLVFGSKEPIQRWFVSRKLPCLIVGSCAPSASLPSIDADFKATCRHAGGVLLRKGHRRIALVLPQHAYGGDADSEQGLMDALASTPGAGLVPLRHNGSAAHICALLDGIMRSQGPPTAYVVARTPHVLTVMMHLMRRGKRIPEDVAVISRDDDPYLQSTSPIVTRYAISPDQLARRVVLAARQMTDTGALEPKAIRLMPEFIAGETA